MCAAITTVAIGAGVAAYTIANAEKQKKDAKKSAREAQEAINAFQPQELNNPFADLQISTLAAEQQTDANLSNYATSVDALQRGGSRNVLGGISRMNDTNVMLQNMISADLDKQAKQRDLMQAQAEERIRAVRENREVNALQGLGNQLQTARQDEASAKANMVSGSLALAGSLQGLSGSFKDTTPPQQRTYNSTVNEISTGANYAKPSPLFDNNFSSGIKANTNGLQSMAYTNQPNNNYQSLFQENLSPTYQYNMYNPFI